MYATRVEQLRDGFAVITSSEREADTLFETNCLNQLNGERYTPILPPEQRAKRTILLFGVDDYIKSHSEEEIKQEIYRVNDFTVNFIDSVYKFPHNAIVKISFSQTAPAQKCIDQGIKMYNMRIPQHQIKEQDYTPVTTCMRCYALDSHYTNQCPKPKEYTICSECGSEEHKWFDCSSGRKQCVNCSGPHRTLAYKCPHRKQAVEKTKEMKKATETKSYSAAVSTHPITTTTNDVFSPEAANKILTCLLQAHLMNTSDPGCFETVLNSWLEMNNLPTIVAPKNPESFKLLRPGALNPQNTMAASAGTEDGDDEDDDDHAEEEELEEEEDEEEENHDEAEVPDQHSNTPLPSPSNTPRPHPPAPRSTKPKTKQHATQSPNHTISRPPSTRNQTAAPNPPSTDPSNRGKNSGTPYNKTRRKH